MKALLLGTAMVMAALPVMAKDMTIGFSQIGSESGWRAAETTVSKEEAKIPVLLLDRDIDPVGKELYLTAVTSDSVHEGCVAGDWLVKTAESKPCSVVEVQGTVGASVAANRKKGFDEALAGHDNLKVVRSQTGDFTRAKGKEVMESFIKAENGGDATATVELTPNMADPAMDAVIAYKTKDTVPPKWIETESKLYTAADDPAKIYESKKNLGY